MEEKVFSLPFPPLPYPSSYFVCHCLNFRTPDVEYLLCRLVDSIGLLKKRFGFFNILYNVIGLSAGVRKGNANIVF